MSEPCHLIEIASESLSAKVNLFGAELHTLKDSDGRDLLWNGDPAVWTGRAPILFPIVGMLVGGSYLLNGERYHLGKHGFARNRWFVPVKVETSSVLLRLGPDPQTLASYPFQFELDIRFALSRATLTVEASIGNLGADPMPASFGFHPAFRWPLPFGLARNDHSIEFALPETAMVRRMDHQGLLLREGEPTPIVGRTLALRDALFDADALIFDQLKSRRLRYGADGKPSLDITFPQMPYLGIWTKPGADFIAIEPWCGVNDPEGFDGDLWHKPGVFSVAPGQPYRVSMAITLVQ